MCVQDFFCRGGQILCLLSLELEFSTFFKLSECLSFFTLLYMVDGEKRFLKTILICSSFLGDGNVTGKFELVYEEDGENQENANNEEKQEEEDTKVRLLFCFALLFCETIATTTILFANSYDIQTIVVRTVKKNLVRVPRVLRNTPVERILQTNGLNPGDMSPESSVS